MVAEGSAVAAHGARLPQKLVAHAAGVQLLADARVDVAARLPDFDVTVMRSDARQTVSVNLRPGVRPLREKFLLTHRAHRPYSSA